uniref:Uncharacterized protein n=1 Tax=Arundo donax TaxID=35708 RepID=A0A0A9FHR3_ARUDO
MYFSQITDKLLHDQ